MLETPEFKALMQHMDQSSNMSSMENTPAVSPTPMSRRPGQILEESNPPSQVPCSSRETTRQGFDTSTDSLGLSLGAGEEDDITFSKFLMCVFKKITLILFINIKTYMYPLKYS